MSRSPTPSLPVLLDMAHYVIERALAFPGEIEFSSPFLACAGTIGGHVDQLFYPPWSAFLCLRNDGCRIWSKLGYSGTPQPGDYFTVNIHQRHGVRARRKLDVLAVICMDGRTQQSAERKLEKSIRAAMREAQQ